MNESELTQSLDDRGLLADSRNPGVYALECSVPPALDAVRRQWDSHHDHRPPDDALDRLASADRVAYVGASGNVYNRLCEHVRADVRTTAFCTVFNPVRVVDVWPTSNPFEREYRRALQLARDGWLCWCDGDLLG